MINQKFISDCRYRVIESSSLVPVLFREVFSHPFISFFHLLVNDFSVIVITCDMDIMADNSPSMSLQPEDENYFAIISEVTCYNYFSERRKAD